MQVPNQVACRLGLGTAQLGLDYGLTNTGGQVPEDEARDLVAGARAAGVGLLDTAAFYGDSEAVLGRHVATDAPFKIVTKTPSIPEDRVGPEQALHVKATFDRSLERLGRDRVYALLVHHGRDIGKPGGERLVEILAEIKARGSAERIGVSVYSELEIESVLERFTPDIVQLPVSLADQRLVNSGCLKMLKAMNVEIHARSVFLQGVLLHAPGELPEYFGAVRDRLKAIGQNLDAQGFGRLEACLAFVLGQPELDVVIVGATCRTELADIVEVADRAARRDLDASALALTDERVLNPSQWRV
jgi:aryl-alcohol dehydrogenase-like predicted oxidoreductase